MANKSVINIGSLECYPIGATGVGATIKGVDFSKLPLAPEVINDMKAAQDRFGVTVYRNTNLDNKSHIDFSRQLGALEAHKLLSEIQGSGANNTAEYSVIPPRFGSVFISDLGNTENDGSMVKKDSRRWWFNKGNALWHVDSSFNQHRSKYSLLRAVKLVSAGGQTRYSDLRSAYDDLPMDKKELIEDLIVEHNIWHSRKLAAPDEFASLTELEMSLKPPAYHKLVQIGPDGRKTMTLASHAKRILGWPQQASDDLIQYLRDHCAQPRYVIEISWKQPTDLVWWDNRTVMHRATPFSDQMEVRDMRRTTVLDDGMYANGVEWALDMERAGTLPYKYSQPAEAVRQATGQSLPHNYSHPAETLSQIKGKPLVAI